MKLRPNLIDRAIAVVSPARALRRAQARTQLGLVQNFAAGLMGGDTSGNGIGYGRHGASSTKKSMLGWFTSRSSADEDISGNLDPLVERSRDLFMGSPLATGAIKTIRTNVVGGGLRLKAAIDFDFLGLSSEEAGRWEANTEREFRLWADSTACDAYRKLNFGQLQSLALLESLHSGDAFAALPIIPRAGSPYDLRIRLISGDRVCNPADGRAAGRDVWAGIEHNKDGEAIGAWVAKYHPSAKAVQNEWQFVRFYGSRTGVPQLLHISQDWERIGQRRGVPLLAPVIETLKQLSRYHEAELMGAVVRSLFTVFVKTQTPQQPFSQQFTGEDQVDAADPASYEMGNGSVVALGENEDVTVASAVTSNPSFDAFVMAMAKYIGAAIEVPVEVLMKHFGNSFSASRGALLEMWKMIAMRREWLVASFVQPIYEVWLAEAVAKGRIKAPGFFADPAVRAAWCGAEWFGPVQGSLNPVQDVAAAAKRVEEGFSTREKEAQQLSGMAWEDIHPVRAREEAQRRADKTIKEAGTWGAQEAAETDKEDGEVGQ